MSTRVRHCVSRLLYKYISVDIDRGRYNKVGGKKFVSFDQAVLFFNSSEIFFVYDINFTSDDFNRWRHVVLFISLCIQFCVSLLHSVRSLCSSKPVCQSVSVKSYEKKTSKEKERKERKKEKKKG